MSLKYKDNLKTYLREHLFETFRDINGEVIRNIIPASIIDKFLSDKNMKMFMMAFTYKNYRTYEESYESIKPLGDLLCVRFMAELVRIHLQLSDSTQYTVIQHDQASKLDAHYKSNKPYALHFSKAFPNINTYIRRSDNMETVPDSIYIEVFESLIEAVVSAGDNISNDKLGIPSGLGISLARNVYRAIMRGFEPKSEHDKGTPKHIISTIFKKGITEDPMARSGIEFKHMFTITIDQSSIDAVNEVLEFIKVKPFTKEELKTTVSGLHLINRNVASNAAYMKLLKKFESKIPYNNYLEISLKHFLQKYSRENSIESKKTKLGDTSLRFILRKGTAKHKHIWELVASNDMSERLIYAIESDNPKDWNNVKNLLLDYYLDGIPFSIIKHENNNSDKARLRNLLLDRVFKSVIIGSNDKESDIIPAEMIKPLFTETNIETFLAAFTTSSFGNYANSYEGAETMGDYWANYFIAKRLRECLKMAGLPIHSMAVNDQAIKLDTYYKGNEFFAKCMREAIPNIKGYIRGKFERGIIPMKVYSDVFEALLETVHMVVERIAKGFGAAVSWNVFRVITKDFTPDINKHAFGTPKSIILEIFGKKGITEEYKPRRTILPASRN